MSTFEDSPDDRATRAMPPVQDDPTVVGHPVDGDATAVGPALEHDPMADTLHPAMATSTSTGSFDSFPAPRVKAGDIHAGRYRLEQQLARRGGALTWRAFDQKLSRSVLVHILAADDPRTPDVLEAARKAAFATDSRFLRVLDAVVGERPDEPALVVCEFAPGESLEKLLKQGPLSALEAAWVARELADAMSSMHSEGLFHQRINPDTVIITATGNVKIVGFLIEAAMYPDAEDGTLAWSEREQADVQAIGKVLYASLVTRWPTPRERMLDEDGNPRLTWGMPPAPMDEHGWLTPRQIRSGVSPALDTICDQVLSEAPRHNEMPLRTASQVQLALGKVLGTADAAADLERRMRYPLIPVGQASEARRKAANDIARDRDRRSAVPQAGDMDATETMAAVGADENTVRPFAPLHPAPRPADDDTPTAVGRLVPADEERPRARPAAPAPRVERSPQGESSSAGGRPEADDPRTAASLRTGRPVGTRAAQRSRPRPRRWLAILCALVAVALVVGLLKACAGGTATTSNGGEAGKAVQVVSAKDFDPSADGGNNEENPGEAKLAVDGNPATAWQSVTYLGSAKLGGLKPGVGLVLDLGSRQQVSRVQLTLKGSPTGVQLRVPADSSTATAPTASVKSWTTVASQTASGTTVELAPTQAVQTRYLLVYLTSLPSVGSNKYRGAIAEVKVTG